MMIYIYIYNFIYNIYVYIYNLEIDIRAIVYMIANFNLVKYLILCTSCLNVRAVNSRNNRNIFNRKKSIL